MILFCINFHADRGREEKIKKMLMTKAEEGDERKK
jgi:hypothetical protein